MLRLQNSYMHTINAKDVVEFYVPCINTLFFFSIHSEFERRLPIHIMESKVKTLFEQKKLYSFNFITYSLN